MPVLPENKVQFNVYLSVEVVREVKHACIDRGQSLSAFVEEALIAQLRRDDAPPVQDSGGSS